MVHLVCSRPSVMASAHLKLHQKRLERTCSVEATGFHRRRSASDQAIDVLQQASRRSLLVIGTELLDQRSPVRPFLHGRSPSGRSKDVGRRANFLGSWIPERDFVFFHQHLRLPRVVVTAGRTAYHRTSGTSVEKKWGPTVHPPATYSFAETYTRGSRSRGSGLRSISKGLVLAVLLNVNPEIRQRHDIFCDTIYCSTKPDDDKKASAPQGWPYAAELSTSVPSVSVRASLSVVVLARRHAAVQTSSPARRSSSSMTVSTVCLSVVRELRLVRYRLSALSSTVSFASCGIFRAPARAPPRAVSSELSVSSVHVYLYNLRAGT